MMETMKLVSKTTGKETEMSVKKLVNKRGEVYICIDNASLTKAFEEAVNLFNARISTPQLISTDVNHPAFQCRVYDDKREYLPVIGEASIETAGSNLWKPYLITLAQMRCIFRALIQYLQFDYDGKIYSVHEHICGTPLQEYLHQQEMKNTPIPDESEILASNEPIPTMEEIKNLGLGIDGKTAETTPETVVKAETEKPAEESHGLIIEDDQPFMEQIAASARPAGEILGDTVIKGGKYAKNPSTLREVYEYDRDWLQLLVDKPTNNASKQQIIDKAKAYIAYREEVDDTQE